MLNFMLRTKSPSPLCFKVAPNSIADVLYLYYCFATNSPLSSTAPPKTLSRSDY